MKFRLRKGDLLLAAFLIVLVIYLGIASGWSGDSFAPSVRLRQPLGP